MKLRPYQEEAADFLYETDRAMVLAPVGAGKTAIALTAMDQLISDGVAARWLVVAPLRVATTVWPAEAKRWTPLRSIAVACGTPKQRRAALDECAEITVTNYDNLQWLVEQEEQPFEAVVFDELTRLKNPSGKRYKAILSILKGVEIRWGLTGSFTSNGLEDVFGQCKIIDQYRLGRSKGAFMQQHFFASLRGNYTEYTPMPGALERVMQAIKPITYRLEGSSSERALHTVPVAVEMDMREYETMRKNFVLEFPDDTAIAQNAAVVTQKLQQLASGFIYPDTLSSIWRSTHKLDAIDDILNENQRAPTIIWYQYIAEREALLQRYPHAIDVKTHDAIDAWNTGKIEVLLAHPASAGHGLNLQHGGHHMIWMSLPWSLELYEQAVGRLHRSGQQHDVWNYVLQTTGTVDEKILAALADKRSLADIALESLK